MKKLNLSRRGRWLRRIVLVTVAVIVAITISTVIVRHIYDEDLKPVAASQKSVQVTIPSGYLAPQISKLLKQKGLIKSEWAFKRYIKNTAADDDIKAGTYDLSPSYSTPEIVSVITEGKIKTNLITFLPGERLDQVRTTLIKSGYSAAEVDQALDPSLYKGHAALVDKPASASLEGYLYPDSYQKSDTTTAQQIIGLSLDEMQKRLSPDLRTAISNQGLSVYQGIVLASITEQEAAKSADRAMIAQVFLNRLHAGMMLQSDVTANYAADTTHQPRSVFINSPYNTYQITGLPPGPISNVSESSLNAVAHPTTNDYLYFVAGDDGKVYYGHTQEEHKALIDQYCKKLCYSP